MDIANFEQSLDESLANLVGLFLAAHLAESEEHPSRRAHRT
jgi:hypothetical protein